MHELQFETTGFEWVDLNHRAEGVAAYKRKGKEKKDDILIILNLTPVVRHNWKVKAHGKSSWMEVFNSDSEAFWGTGNVFNPAPECQLIDKDSGLYEINVHLPALGGIVLH